MDTTVAVEKINLFGISIHNMNMEEAIEEIHALVSGGGKHFVATPNVDHIVRLHRDREFLEVYQKASLVVADGLPIIWASRLLGKPLKERVAGSDLILPVCELAAKEGFSIYFLGGERGVAEKAGEKLKLLFPSLQIAGSYAPPFGFESDTAENQRIVQMINEAKPDILFVALGAPKQEKWIARHIEELRIKMALCVGAGIDFIAGAAKRAPRWMRGVGLEWLWRLVHDPKRLWKRYLVQDAKFLGIFFDEWRRLHLMK